MIQIVCLCTCLKFKYLLVSTLRIFTTKFLLNIVAKQIDISDITQNFKSKWAMFVKYVIYAMQYILYVFNLIIRA